MDQEAMGREWWTRFESAFVTAVCQIDADTLCRLWHEPKDPSGKIGRTRLYDRHVLPTVGDCLGLLVEREKSGRVDWVLSTAQDAIRVPVMFVESETATQTIADDELPKLCSRSAPLKVLIVCDEWDPDPVAWPPLGGFRDRYLPIWERVIAAFARHWAQRGVLGIIVGEWRGDQPRPVNCSTAGRLSFWGRAYSGDGQLIDGAPNFDRLLWCQHFTSAGGQYLAG